MKKLLGTMFVAVDKIPFIPIAGQRGDNVMYPSPNLDWYQGPTLVQAMVNSIKHKPITGILDVFFFFEKKTFLFSVTKVEG